MAIVDIFIPCLGVPMATESCDPLVEVGNRHCRRVSYMLRSEPSLCATTPSGDDLVNGRFFHRCLWHPTLTAICYGS